MADAEAAVRQSLQSDDLAPLAIDILARLPSREAQQDLANLATSGTRPAPVRTQAADALLKHVHAFGKFVTGPQTDALITAIDAADDVELRSKLLALQGVLRTDSKATGDRLRKYAPKVIEGKVDAPPPKEEPKDKPEEKKE